MSAAGSPLYNPNISRAIESLTGINREREQVTHPPCANTGCPNPVPRNPGEGAYYWLRRKCCSKECLGRYIASCNTRNAESKAREHEPCTSCGGLVPQREGEPRNSWWQRRCCSEACARKRASSSIEKASAALAQKRAARKAGPKFTLNGASYADYDIDPGDNLGRVFRPATHVETRVAGWW
jgi:hypothetical protein